MPGIFISEGMRLRIPSFSIGIDDEGNAHPPQVALEVALDVWPYWLDVAIDEAVTGRDVRARLRAALDAAKGAELDGQLQGTLLVQECMAGMKSISASAFALDNFFAVIRDFLPQVEALEQQWAAAGTARHRRVSESVRRTFKMSNAGAKQLHDGVATVFRFRDWAVHPPADFRNPLQHDLLDVGVEWRFMAFRASNACNAAGFVAAAIGQCLAAPRSNNAALVEWCANNKPRSQQRWDRAQNEFGGGSSPSSPQEGGSEEPADPGADGQPPASAGAPQADEAGA